MLFPPRARTVAQPFAVFPGPPRDRERSIGRREEWGRQARVRQTDSGMMYCICTGRVEGRKENGGKEVAMGREKEGRRRKGGNWGWSERFRMNCGQKIPEV